MLNKNTINNNNNSVNNSSKTASINLFQSNLSSQSSSSLSSSQPPLRPPFYTLQNNGSTPSLSSQAPTLSANQNSGNLFASGSADLFFNKYNHLAQYQKQQSFLSAAKAPFNLSSNNNNSSFNNNNTVLSPNNSLSLLSPGNGSGILSPSQSITNSANNSFNQSLAYFNNNAQSTRAG